MKKVWIVVVGVVVVAVGVSLAFLLTPNAKKLKLLLDTKGKPAVEAYLKAETGDDIELTYAASESTSDGLLLRDLTLASKTKPGQKIVAKEALLSELTIDTTDWGLSISLRDIVGGPGGPGGMRGQLVELNKLKVGHDGKKVSFVGGKARAISFSDPASDMTLAEADVEGFELTDGHRVKVAKGGLKGLVGRPDKDGDLRLAALKFEGLETSSQEQLFILANGSVSGLEGKADDADVALGDAYLENVYFDKENVVKLGKVEAKGIKALSQGGGVEMALFSLAGIPQMDLDEPGSWQFGAARMEGLNVMADGKKVATVASLESETLSANDVITSSSKMTDLWIGVATMDPAGRAQLEAMGFSELRLSAVLNYEAKLKAETVELKELSISGQDLGNLLLTAKFGGLKIDPANIEASMAACPATATIERGEFKYEDKGLLRKLIAAQAKEAGLGPEQFVERQNQPMIAQAKEAGSQEMLQVAEAVDRFMKSYGSLRIVVQPDAPVKLMELGGMAPAQSMKLLKVSAEAN